jgi:hypothetical protein
LAQVPQRDINLVVRAQIDPLALMSDIRKRSGRLMPTSLWGSEDNGTGEEAEHALGEAAHLG